jgi:acyl-coenzyme A synthetase/AMP-(fatty) acid ligase
MMVNRPEFALCDTAALHLGAIPFSVYNTFAPEQIADVFAPDTAPGVAAPRGVPRQRGDDR